MRYLVLDTENTGLFRYKDEEGNTVPSDAPGQPRMASLSLCYVEESGEIERQQDFYVKPDGWSMPDEAMAINGLTNEFLNEHGKPVTEALAAYVEAIEAGYIVVAFNAQHDLRQVRAELRRSGMDDLFEQTKNVCLMRACGSLNVAKANGKRGWPGLADVCAHFGIKNEGAHTAGGDTRAAFAIFRKLRELGALPQPEVFYAKNHAPAQAANDPQPAPSMNF